MVGIRERVEGFLGTWRRENELDSFSDRIDQEKKARMAQGEKKHGPLDLVMDPRNFIQEGIEELIDFLNYSEMAMLQGKLSFCKWTSVDQTVRFVIYRLHKKGSDQCK